MTSLADFLAGEYAMLRAYLGAVAFDRLTLAMGEPASHPAANLRRAADRLPQTIAQALGQQRHSEATELALLEKALNLALAAPDIAALSPQGLHRLTPDSRITLHPSASLLRFSTNAISIAAALRCQELPPPAAALKPAQALLVWRQDDGPRFRVLGREEERALKSLKRGLTASAFTAPPSSGQSQKEAPLQAYLMGWIEAGLLIAD